MKTITITVEADSRHISREYAAEGYVDTDTWGERVNKMLDVLEESKEVKF